MLQPGAVGLADTLVKAKGLTLSASHIGGVGTTDPVFISYRQSDGTDLANDFSWLLRAAGVPVWRDQNDLPPGDTDARLEEALTNGLSGSVLIVTPDISDSEIVKFTEAPRIIQLHEANPAFALAVANAVERGPGKIDYDAPDRLLARPKGSLGGVKQYPTRDRKQRAQLVREMVWHRIGQSRDDVAARGSTIEISIQTRNMPQVHDRTSAHLDVRTRPPTNARLPNGEGLLDLQATIGILPDAVTRSGATTVRITGGAHLSVAFALGAALPSSRVGSIEVVDQRGETWASGTESVASDGSALLVAETVTADPDVVIGRADVGVYLDLLPSRSDAAFDRFRDEHPGDLGAWTVLTAADDGLLDPADAGRLAAEAAMRMRALSNTNANATVHLFLRCPFPIAVLLGRLTNTLHVIAYEWDNSDPGATDHRPQYVPSLRVRASAPGGVVDEVLLPGAT